MWRVCFARFIQSSINYTPLDPTHSEMSRLGLQTANASVVFRLMAGGSVAEKLNVGGWCLD